MTQQGIDINELSVEAIRYTIEQVDEPSFDCRGCGIDTDEIYEYYMVQFSIWETVVPKEYQSEMLCIGCLEGYLGRQLVSADFTEVPLNYFPDKSERLLNRLGEWFRAFDGPYETVEEFRAASIEATKRLKG